MNDLVLTQKNLIAGENVTLEQANGGADVKIDASPDAIELATDAERTALLAPLSKFYYVKATGKLWRWDGAKWVNLSPDCLPLNGVAKAAEKLQTARSISLGGIVSGSASFDGSANKTITVSPASNELMALYKAYTYNTAGVLTVLDAAAMGLWRNMSAFLAPENVTYETSADGGETWTTDTALTTEAMTRGIFSGYYGNGSIAMFKSPAPMTTSKQMRMTIDVGTGRYGAVSRLYLYVNIANHVVMLDVERATKGSPDVFVPVVSDKTISGWSGPNIISLGGAIAWGGGSTNNTQRFRLTFRCTSVNDAYPNSIPIIYDIRLYGDTVFIPNNNLQNGGHLYKWDANQNATFPANLTAASIDATKLTGVMPEAVHPTTAGNKHIPAGGATNNILAHAGAGTAGWTDFRRTMMVHAGSVNANSDFNDCTTPGEYTVSANPVVNGPSSAAYGLLLVLTRSNTNSSNPSNYVYQFFMPSTANETAIFARHRNGTGIWTAWESIINSTNVATTTANGLMSAADKTKLDGLSAATAVDACSLFGTGITPPELLGKYVKQADGSYANAASAGNGGYVIRLNATSGTWEIYSTDFASVLWTTAASVTYPWQVDAWAADPSSFATGTPMIIQL